MQRIADDSSKNAGAAAVSASMRMMPGVMGKYQRFEG